MLQEIFGGALSPQPSIGYVQFLARLLSVKRRAVYRRFTFRP
jgi:hypothetical protein